MIVKSKGWILLAAIFVAPAAPFSFSHFHASKRTNRSRRATDASSTAMRSIVDEESSKMEVDQKVKISTRRTFWEKSFLTAACVSFAAPPPSNAFANAVEEAKKYADKPKRRGSPPKDLGLQSRTTEGMDGESVTTKRLRSCDGNPNCFSTTGDALLEDRQQYGVDFLVAPWIPPEDQVDPLRVIESVVASYEPGQGGIDGGGFALVEKQAGQYLYYQFEAMKKGFIDDVEFAVTNDTKGVQVRSASRVGVTDFGVNAVRLNYIARQLRSKGWSIADITPDTHRDYWITANEAREATFDADRRNMD